MNAVLRQGVRSGIRKKELVGDKRGDGLTTMASKLLPYQLQHSGSAGGLVLLVGRRSGRLVGVQ